jgi:hypothetical protein
LLDPANPSVTLFTLERAASALGKRLKVELAKAGVTREAWDAGRGNLRKEAPGHEHAFFELAA